MSMKLPQFSINQVITIAAGEWFVQDSNAELIVQCTDGLKRGEGAENQEKKGQGTYNCRVELVPYPTKIPKQAV